MDSPEPTDLELELRGVFDDDLHPEDPNWTRPKSRERTPSPERVTDENRRHETLADLEGKTYLQIDDEYQGALASSTSLSLGADGELGDTTQLEGWQQRQLAAKAAAEAAAAEAAEAEQQRLAAEAAAEAERAEKEAEELAKPPTYGTSRAAGGDRKLQLRQIIEFSDDILADLALSPQHSRSCQLFPGVLSDEDKMKKPKNNFGNPPTADGRRPSLGLGKVRPGTPIDGSVKKMNDNRLHVSAYASTLDAEVLAIQQRTKEMIDREAVNKKALVIFKSECLEKALEARRIRESVAVNKVIKQEKQVISGFARAKASQLPLRKRHVLKDAPPRW